MSCAIEGGGMRFTTTPFLRACKNGGCKKLFATHTGPSLVTVEKRPDRLASGGDQSPLRMSIILGNNRPSSKITPNRLSSTHSTKPKPGILTRLISSKDSIDLT